MASFPSLSETKTSATVPSAASTEALTDASESPKLSSAHRSLSEMMPVVFNSKKAKLIKDGREDVDAGGDSDSDSHSDGPWEYMSGPSEPPAGDDLPPPTAHLAPPLLLPPLPLIPLPLPPLPLVPRPLPACPYPCP